MKNLKIWLSSLLHQSSRSSYSAGNNVRTILRMGWNFYLLCGSGFPKTHSPLAQRLRTPSEVPPFDLLAQGHWFSAGWWGAGSDLTTHPAAAVGLLSLPVPGQQNLPLSLKTWGEKNQKNLSCRSGVNVQNRSISSLMDLLLQNG